MHARRTPYLLIAALLTSGCVAVPHGPAPGPPDRPAALAPAAERAPSPLPTRPDPPQGTPREALVTTEPRTEPARTPASRRPAAEKSGTGAVPRSPKTTTKQRTTKKKEATKKRGTTKKRETTRKDRTRAVPRPPKRKRPLQDRNRPSTTTAGQPELRRLCRQAERIEAPMGAADLCRGMYGR
ncbi:MULTISPECIES: hypothetical protein [unclassified Streptomyces]|uniref:hypothetical protein n=1 Tax=unclassified Streptomyces TaxID=2593676 RepID=UPI0033BC64B2